PSLAARRPSPRWSSSKNPWSGRARNARAHPCSSGGSDMVRMSWTARWSRWSAGNVASSSAASVRLRPFASASSASTHRRTSAACSCSTPRSSPGTPNVSTRRFTAGTRSTPKSIAAPRRELTRGAIACDFRPLRPLPCVAQAEGVAMRRNHLFLLWMSAIAACGSKQGEEPDGPPPAQPDGPACPAATGPTHHSASINADETWTAAGSPHLVDFSISIHAKVTIEACAEVRIASNATITVGPGGAIVGEGTADQRIAIGAIDVEQPWATIRAIGGSIRLAHATVSDGGLPPGNAVPFTCGAFIAPMGTDPRAHVAALSVVHVGGVGSRSDGIQMSVSQFDAASTDLTIVGAAEYPVRLDPSALGSLPSGSYVGNAHDEILVPGGSVVADMTIHARGVPYHIGDSVASHELRVGTTPGSPVATLTIEPNVTLRFESDGVLAVEHFTGTNPASGALVARGTAAAP